MESQPVRWSIEDLRARKPEALTAMVNDHLPTLLAGALAVGLSRADAEEVVQDTFAAFLSSADRFEGRSSLRTYLFGILYHKASNLRAKTRREAGVEDIEAFVGARFNEAGMWSRPPLGPEALALDEETRRMVEKCSEGLPVAQRTAFFLKEVEGETPEAICGILGVTPVNLRVMLHRARLTLRECLEATWEKSRR